ncbi:TMEM175 family protein [Streptomyces sp. NPDC050564]|uniref:TMEM175 family protein n=1 Tax=Streptomyces sp. NPDC050564 TaxID=3365631 RepID=UPI0037A90A89
MDRMDRPGPGGGATSFSVERNPADGVIAIAVTLLVLEIRPPHDTRHLLHGLAALWPSYLAYGLTFIGFDSG